MKYRNIKIIALAVTFVLFFSSIICPIETSAASPFDFTIDSVDSESYESIVAFLDVYTSEQTKEKIIYLMSGSAFAPIGGGRFFYPNYGSSTHYVYDENDPYGIYSYRIAGGTGCWAYSCFVESFVFGDGWDAHNTAGYRIYASDMLESTSEGQLKYFIQNYAQPGEHIRIGDYHSISFLAYDGNGFYFMDYWGSGYSEPYPITMHYASWSTFASYYNVNSVFLFECDTSTNNITLKDAFPDYVFRDYIKTVILKNSFISDNESIAHYILNIRRTKQLNLAALQIKNLYGIEYFAALEYLDCSYNQLDYLDLSDNTMLKTVKCAGNQLTEIAGYPESLTDFNGGVQNIDISVTKGNDGKYSFYINDFDSETVTSVSGALVMNGMFVVDEKTVFPALAAYEVNINGGTMTVAIHLSYPLEQKPPQDISLAASKLN